ncbi:RNA 3'-terminal phosphate cyclase [Schizopora paradoxa]|uniref:RNA 3'-terminal phosphate cyclase n=1 Tax=Schizopora paradoxa TaxID=27342 RepID=A0A0H2S551_9AGAM|nr:RNA 3'-terminal phosphate cyclase [Schizopora paradoxa]
MHETTTHLRDALPAIVSLHSMLRRPASLLRTMTTSATANLKTIDGGTLEGGGQILRNTVALSALFSKPVCIVNVRQNRKPPGLKPQHAAGLKLVETICDATTEGIEKGSRTVNFSPSSIHTGNFIADPGTAGSTTLLLQVSLPVLLFPSPPEDSSDPLPSSSKIILRGGTNALNAPPIDYTQHIFLPFLYKHFGFSPDTLSLHVKRRGYFPRGGGEIQVTVPAFTKGQTIPPLNLIDRGSIARIHGFSYVSGSLLSHLAEQIRSAALDALNHIVPPEIEDKESFVQISARVDKGEKGGSPGSGIMLWAETTNGCIIGGSALGSKNVLATDTGTAAANELLRNLKHGGCVDEYLQDQIIIFMALAKGKSSIAIGPVTLHTKTAIWVAEQMTSARFELTELDTDRGLSLLTCEGSGLEGRI